MSFVLSPRLRGWGGSLVLHGVALVTLWQCVAADWLTLPLAPGLATVEITAQVVEPTPPEKSFEVSFVAPEEPAPQTVAAVRAEAEVAFERTTEDVAFSESAPRITAFSRRAEATAQPVESLPAETPPLLRRPPTPTRFVSTAPVAVPARPAPPNAGVADAPPPRPIFNPAPQYPAAELAAGVTGRVIFLAQIDVTGTVASLLLERSSGHPALDRAAREAILRWRFESARSTLIAHREIRIPVNFRIAQ